METHEKVMTEVDNEVRAMAENFEMKIPRAKIRVKSNDRTPSALSIKKIMIRQSNDSPTKQPNSYEIISQKRPPEVGKPPPSVQLERYELPPAQSPQEKALNNGLDPIGIELISSSNISAGSEYSDKSDDHHTSPKMNREMKNLQKSTNDSKILSDYLTTSTESPRRNRKNKDVPILDPDEEEEVIGSSMEISESPRRSRKNKDVPIVDPDEHMDEVIDSSIDMMEESPRRNKKNKDVPIVNPDEVEEEEETSFAPQRKFWKKKNLPTPIANDEVESDSELVSAMEPPEKRRKSIALARKRSSSTTNRGRKKSIARQLKEELLATSDKDEAPEDEDEDPISEGSFVTSRSIEGRAVNPPPKVS